MMTHYTSVGHCARDIEPRAGSLVNFALVSFRHTKHTPTTLETGRNHNRLECGRAKFVFPIVQCSKHAKFSLSSVHLQNALFFVIPTLPPSAFTLDHTKLISRPKKNIIKKQPFCIIFIA